MHWDFSVLHSCIQEKRKQCLCVFRKNEIQTSSLLLMLFSNLQMLNMQSFPSPTNDIYFHTTVLYSGTSLLFIAALQSAGIRNKKIDRNSVLHLIWQFIIFQCLFMRPSFFVECLSFWSVRSSLILQVNYQFFMSGV